MLKLVIGDKNRSSWSMRAWLAIKQSQLPFEEVLIRLDRSDSRELIRKHSPSSMVPCLIHDEVKIWDSLAIAEYLNELAPDKGLWPSSPERRALARAYCAEMHSGFPVMRMQLSMDIRLRTEIRHLTPQTVADVQRILHLWREALEESGGPFLFGGFSIADAFYAPVVFRFLSYGIQINDPLVQQYIKSIESFPIVQDWVNAARDETPYTVEFGG